MQEKKPYSIIVTILISLMIVIIGLAACVMLGKLFPRTTVNQRFIRTIIPRMIVGFLCIIGMNIVYRNVRLGFCKDRMVLGMLISIPMIIYTIGNFMESSHTDAPKNFEQITFMNLLLCFLANMSVGFFEEVLLRGTVLNVMRKRWEQHKYGAYGAVFVSSLIFGVVHMVNYFNGSSYLNPTIAQVFYATFIGIFMASVYLKTGNLWIVIILHGLFDFAPGFWELTTPNKLYEKLDMSVGTIIYLIIFYLPLAVAGFFITRSYVKETREGCRTLDN